MTRMARVFAELAQLPAEMPSGCPRHPRHLRLKWQVSAGARCYHGQAHINGGVTECRKVKSRIWKLQRSPNAFVVDQSIPFRTWATGCPVGGPARYVTFVGKRTSSNDDQPRFSRLSTQDLPGQPKHISKHLLGEFSRLSILLTRMV